GRAGVLRPVWRRDCLCALERCAPALAHEPGHAVQQSHSVEHDGLGVVLFARTGHDHVLDGHGFDHHRSGAGPGQLDENIWSAGGILTLKLKLVGMARCAVTAPLRRGTTSPGLACAWFVAPAKCWRGQRSGCPYHTLVLFGFKKTLAFQTPRSPAGP